MWNCPMPYINQLWIVIFNNNFNPGFKVRYNDQCQECQREREGEPLTEDQLAVVQMHKADGRKGQADKNAADDPTFAA